MYPYEMFDPLFEAKIQVAVLNVHMKSSHTTFVKLSCAGYEKQTSAKSEKHSATFNEEFDFTVTDPKAVLRVELWTKGSMFTTSRILGVLDICERMKIMFPCLIVQFKNNVWIGRELL